MPLFFSQRDSKPSRNFSWVHPPSLSTILAFSIQFLCYLLTYVLSISHRLYSSLQWRNPCFLYQCLVLLGVLCLDDVCVVSSICGVSPISEPEMNIFPVSDIVSVRSLFVPVILGSCRSLSTKKSQSNVNKNQIVNCCF